MKGPNVALLSWNLPGYLTQGTRLNSRIPQSLSHLSTFCVSSALIQPLLCNRASDSCAALGCTRLNSAKPAKLRAQYRARDSAEAMNCAPHKHLRLVTLCSRHQ